MTALGRAALLLTACFLFVVSSEAPRATAQVPELLTQIPTDGEVGEEAGQLNNPGGIVSNPSTGHFYVGDVLNQRVSEFTAWGEFVKAWGWGVLDGTPELQICTQATGCQQGIGGDGAGQVDDPVGLALDASGNVYVADMGSKRVQKFDPSGDFLLMFGWEVNKTTKANICTKADLGAGDVCGIGITGSAPGQFNFAEEFARATRGDYIDVGPDGLVYVGDKDRIQKFSSGGDYQSQIPLPQTRMTKALAVDPLSGDVYAALAQATHLEDPEVPVFYRLNSTTGTVLDEILVGDPEAEPFPTDGFSEGLAVDPAGNVYVFTEQHMGSLPAWEEVLAFDSAGKAIVPAGSRFAEPPPHPPGKTFEQIELATVGIGSGCGVINVYVGSFNFPDKSYIRAYGPTPDPTICPPPPVPPTIDSQYAVSVDADGATVRAEINPRFWGDATYYVEYGTEDCSLGGCETVLAPGASLGGKAVNVPVRSAGVFLGAGEPLQPGTTYHYRFVAQSSGGGPVFGPDRTFTTFALSGPENTACLNQDFRLGPSAKLPNCRAYEMVSPLDKSNGDAMLLGENARTSQLNQVARDGQRFTFSSYRPFAEPEGAAAISQYLVTRDPQAGWTSKAISPPRGVNLVPVLRTFRTEYRAFSPDLCQGWLRHDTDHSPFAPDAIGGFSNLYRRDLCGNGGYEALTKLEDPLEEPNNTSEEFISELQGVSADGECAVYRASGKLTANASSALNANGDSVMQLYESCKGDLSLVSILPNGSACSAEASAGTPNVGPSSLEERTDAVAGAVSEDGSRVFWSCDTQLYARINGKLTIAVSLGSARFWAASTDGSSALFTAGEDLFRFEIQGKKTTLVAKGVAGLAGTSEDLSRIYLVSKEALDGGAKAGAPNLYLHEAGAFTFIATLAEADVATNAPFSVVHSRPLQRATRVTADGDHLAFMSTSSLTGYDNTDLESGKANAEIYLYEVEMDELACISCSPSGARPLGRVVGGFGGSTTVSAKLPTWETQLYPERALSDDGSRLYFESYQALELSDTNGAQDVYQWEAAGIGDCDERDSAFNEDTGGCVELISSGQSPQDSEFLDATPDGSDVFFATGAGLVVQDLGLVDVYDARVGGGFPPPPAAPKACEGEACQGTPTPPDDPTPASLTFQGAGNVTGSGQVKPSCGKGRRAVRKAGRTRCVKKPKQSKGKRRNKRRAGR